MVTYHGMENVQCCNEHSINPLVDQQKCNGFQSRLFPVHVSLSRSKIGKTDFFQCKEHELFCILENLEQYCDTKHYIILKHRKMSPFKSKHDARYVMEKVVRAENPFSMFYNAVSKIHVNVTNYKMFSLLLRHSILQIVKKE